ncbi:hypothetical protein LPUS_07185 [Lasallia pustulata]|uniref:Uncharacterized protein n=1 Tax=Lasallia pustulata TaxID=136370 RepID=A0A1W5D2L3_9LECA|nr:hypothetical protein LPUS_07185 [Lasallia pustulata]
MSITTPGYLPVFTLGNFLLERTDSDANQQSRLSRNIEESLLEYVLACLEAGLYTKEHCLCLCQDWNFPYNPSLVLNIITKPQPTEPYVTSRSPKTPMTGRAVCRLQKAYKKALSEPLVAKLFRANERLTAKNSIGTHMILGFTAALREEKRRRKRGKRLNLLGEKESGPQFFSPGRVTAARTWQAEKEEEEQQCRQDIESSKALVAFKKLQKEEEKLQKAAVAVEKQQLAVEAKTAKGAESQA